MAPAGVALTVGALVAMGTAASEQARVTLLTSLFTVGFATFGLALLTTGIALAATSRPTTETPDKKRPR